jgi:hypothetical protein
MADESLREFLERRERELVQQIAGIKAQLEPREAELDQIRRLKITVDAASESTLSGVEGVGSSAASIAVSRTNPAPTQAATATVAPADAAKETPKVTIKGIADGIYALDAGLRRASRAFAEAADRNPFLEFEHLTIKQLAVKALSEYFKDGATALQICEFIDNAYGRRVERSSLSPQLSRLHQDNVLEWVPDKGLYRLPRGSLLYGVTMPSGDQPEDIAKATDGSSGLPFDQGGDTPPIKRRRIE